MSDYTITTDFGAKDSLPSGNAAKIIKGSEFTTEFTNIKTAVNTKADTAGDTFTGVVNFSADVAVNTNTLFVDVSTARVGIGTSSPDQALHLYQGALKIESGAPRIYLTDVNHDSDYSILNDNGLFGIYDDTNTSYRLRIDASGNVGIGTASPTTNYTKTLHIHGSGTGASLHLTDPTSGATASDGLEVFQYGTDGYIWEREAGNLRFGTSAEERMRINSGGNVGIGTSSPSTNLHVAGGSSGTNQALFRTSSGGGGGLQIVCSDLSVSNPLWSINTFFGEALAFGDGTNEHMRIDTSGNVLVGTTDSSVYDSTSGGNTGFVYSPNGFLQVARQTTTNAQSVMNLNKMGADGNIIELYKDGTAVGSISVRNTDNLTIEGNSTHSGLSFGTNELLPFKNGAYIDSTLNIGSTTFKFKDIYRSGSTYSTSDRNKKQDIRDLTDAEARVAVVAKGSLKAFRYIDTVEAEGADANIHFGIIAQDLKAAFEAEGLNADSYQVLKTSTYTDDDGVEQTTYSVCYENLLAFIISAI